MIVVPLLLVGAAIVGLALLAREKGSPSEPASSQVEIVGGVAYATPDFRRIVRARLEGQRAENLTPTIAPSVAAEFVALGASGEENAAAWFDRRIALGRTVIVSVNSAKGSATQLGAVSAAAAELLARADFADPVWAIVASGGGPDPKETSTSVEPSPEELAELYPIPEPWGELAEQAIATGNASWLEQLATQLEQAGMPVQASTLRARAFA